MIYFVLKLVKKGIDFHMTKIKIIFPSALNTKIFQPVLPTVLWFSRQDQFPVREDIMLIVLSVFSMVIMNILKKTLIFK